MAGDKFIKKPKFQYFRERVVELQDKFVNPQRSAEGKYISQEEKEELIDRAKKVKGKAERLLAVVDDSYKHVCIPVPEHAKDVRAALQRLGLSKDEICYPKYREFTREIRDNNIIEKPEELYWRISGHRLTDARLVEESKDNPMSELLIHFFVLWSVQKLIQDKVQIENNVALAEAGALKTPVVKTGIDIVLALGTLALIDGGISGLAEDLKNNFSFDSLIEGTPPGFLDDPIAHMEKIRDSENRPIGETISNGIRRGHRESDVNLVKDYYDKTAPSASQSAMESTIASDLMSFADDMDHVINAAEDWGESVTALTHPVYDVDNKPNVLRDVSELWDADIDATNEAVDRLLAVLDDKYTSDLICCLLLHFSAHANVDTRFLKILQSLLEVAGNGIRINFQGVQDVLGSLNRQLKRQLLEPILSQIRLAFDAVANGVLEFLDTDDEEWQLIFICTPIDEMIEYLLDAMEELEDMVISIMEKLWDDIEIKIKTSKKKYELLSGNKRAAKLSKLLDHAIDAIEAGELCAQENMTPEEKIAFTKDVNKLIDTPFDGSVLRPSTDPDVKAVRDPYAEFNVIHHETHNGFVVSNPESYEVEQGHTASAGREFNLDECAKNMVQKSDLFKNFADYVTRELGNGRNNK